MKYNIKITKSIWMFDVKRININAEQGWTFNKTDDYHSEYIEVQKFMEVEFENDCAAIRYANNLKNLTYGKIICECMESSASTLTFDRKENIWVTKTGENTRIYNNNTGLWENT